MGLVSFISKSIEVIPPGPTTDNDGVLGSFAVTANALPSDIAKAAALQYHDIDINHSHHLFKSLVLRRKGIKSKFAKKNDDDDDEGDSDVDEATREESAPNDPKHQRIINAHLARMARTNADLSNLKKFRGNTTS